MVIEERRIEKRSFFKRADGLCGLCTQWKWLSWSIPSVISSFKSETIQIYLEMHLGSTLGLEKAFHFPRFVCVRFLIDQIGNPFKYSPQHVQAVFFSSSIFSFFITFTLRLLPVSRLLTLLPPELYLYTSFVPNPLKALFSLVRPYRTMTRQLRSLTFPPFRFECVTDTSKTFDRQIFISLPCVR
jgi:hypothetical protein